MRPKLLLFANGRCCEGVRGRAWAPSEFFIAHRLVQLLSLYDSLIRVVLLIFMQELKRVGNSVIGMRQIRQATLLVLLQSTLRPISRPGSRGVAPPDS